MGSGVDDGDVLWGVSCVSRLRGWGCRLLHEKLSKNRKVVIVSDEDTGQSRSDLYRYI